ncbi:head GIN domain-containing protein [Hymenobacter endophyticus]|uniref:Head GIN domain-containing protein n=1 Tax=Hymenobacter endophyticus TaxID=3076335 RepID=A0ABU3TEB8_9BACT|nr:head GIN domain-containing protein [Hymenobacter endophyticus]MDU0369715.1 head GIN domain-containing protein [Hymenobacter endophyticus]
MKTFFLSAFASTVTLLAAGPEAQAQQLRPVSGFQQLKASGAIDVYIKQGSTTEVRVEAEPDVLTHVHTEVKGATLLMYRDQGLSSLLSNKKVSVYITCPTLTGVEVSGASDVKSETTFTADTFTIRASGASDVTMRLNVKTLTATASGASDLRLTGQAERQQITISGSSDYKGYELQSRTASVQASGASDAYVAVTDELQSRASGASDVHYKGKPRLTR